MVEPMTDATLRARFADFEGPEFTSPAFSPAPSLGSAQVAIVTTAGLKHEAASWERGDQSFQVVTPPFELLRLTHVSQNFDRAGFVADWNVVFPVDRLSEMARDGLIEAVAPRHISFMGAQWDNLETIRLDTGPAAGQLLLEDGTNVAILTGVCPLCPRTVAALAHALEAQGLATVVLSSNRALTERIQPPRALHCEFPLGRPLGVPGDAAFQRRVLETALGTLSASEPILARFPIVIEAPQDATLSCPVPPAVASDADPAVNEVLGLRAAFERQRAGRGATLVGRLVDPDGLPEFLGALKRIVDGEDEIEEVDVEGWLAPGGLDLKAYYEEAALALVDHVPAARQTESWYFEETLAGTTYHAAILALRTRGLTDQQLLATLPASQHPTEG